MDFSSSRHTIFSQTVYFAQRGKNTVGPQSVRNTKTACLWLLPSNIAFYFSCYIIVVLNNNLNSLFLEFIVLFVKNGANIMYQLTLHCNKLITTVTWWTECWLLCILELVFFICLFRWKSFCCNTNWSIVSCVAILWETLAKGMNYNQSGFYLSFQGGRGFFSLDAKDLSSRRVWLHGLQPKNLEMFMPENVF